MLQKVTAFITRASGADIDLLLLRHPFAGIQFPAGTVEDGELPVDAAIREAGEETGLTRLSVIAHIGVLDEKWESNRRVVQLPTRVYARPDETSSGWAHFRPGLYVTELRSSGDWVQVEYLEWDQIGKPRYCTYCLRGWVPRNTVADRLRRHLYHLDASHLSTPNEWTAMTDGHTFTLFWAPLRALPPVVGSQSYWLEHARAVLRYEFT